MNDSEHTRIHYRGEAYPPVIAPQYSHPVHETKVTRDNPHPYSNAMYGQISAYAQPQHEPTISVFERAIIMVASISVTLFVVVNFVIYYRVYTALQELGEQLSQVPGLGN